VTTVRAARDSRGCPSPLWDRRDTRRASARGRTSTASKLLQLPACFPRIHSIAGEPWAGKRLHRVSLRSLDARFREAGRWSYARTENDPRYRYRDRAFGLAEGLALDEQHVYIVLDNNDEPRLNSENDRRGLLFVFKRPR